MNQILKKGIPLSVIFIIVFSASVLAAEEEIVQVQGLMMALDLKKNAMIVNEKIFAFNQNTTFHNDKGAAITIDKLRPKMWVYIEGLKDKTNKRIIARKIYLLPKYIEEKEKRLYPFIQ